MRGLSAWPENVLRRLAVGTVVAGLAVGAAVVTVPGVSAADEQTVSADSARTGWDPNEPALAPAQVTAGDFGQQFAATVDGSVYAQPLIVGGTVVVTTERAKAYGIDAATGAIRWSRAFGAPFEAATIGCGDLAPDLGQTSTPVYDPAAAAIYLTTKIDDGPAASQPHWYLHAISPIDGAEKPGFPVTLQGTADNDPTVTFTPYLQQQRPGLLLAGGSVYLGFGSHCDIRPYRGWIIAVKVTGLPHIQSVWTAEAGSGGGGGVWQAGGGLLTDGTDPAGNPRVFLATGNGLSPPIGAGASPPHYLGDSLVRVGLDRTGHLSADDFFAPANAATLDQNDADLGSGGPAALPDSFGTRTHPHLLVIDGKDGRLFLLDRDNLGGRGQGPNGTDAAVQTVGPERGVWGHPAVYPGEGGWVYYVQNHGPLQAYQRSTTPAGDPALSGVGASHETFGYTSGSPVVTSDGIVAGSALVWTVYAADATGAAGQLRAYDATPTGGTLRLRWSAPIGVVSKFALPATSGGRIYVGTRDGHLLAFGRPAAVALAGQPVDINDVEVGSTGVGTAHFTATRPVTVTGAAAGTPFTVDISRLPVTLAAGDGLDLPVAFHPAVPGGATAVLTVRTDAGPIPLDLHGLATQAGLSAAPSRLDFVRVPTTSTESLTVIVSNTGTGDEAVTSVTAPGQPFTATGGPAAGTLIPAQQSVALSVSYAPTIAGAQSDSIVIVATDGTLTVPLTGTAQTGHGHLSVSQPAADFGRVVVGTSRTQTFDLTNTGNIPITITKAKAPAGQFTSADPLSEGITMLPGDVVHQQVTFTPTAVGPVGAGYEVTADDGQGAQVETLSGTGVNGSRLPPPTGAGWTRNGAATVSGADLVLTPARPGVGGSAFSNTVLRSDGMDAACTVQIGGGSGADGMTFTMLSATGSATSIGARGGGLGYGGLPNAVAVALDTSRNASDPSDNFVGVAAGTLRSYDALHYVATSTDIGRLTAGTHQLDVNVSGGRIRVSVDDLLKIDIAIALPAMVRPGFTAGTGQRFDQHLVRNVSITTPT